MGRAAGAALKVVAPEAAVASSAAAAAGGGRRRSASDPRVSAPGSKAAQQRRAIEQIKADRPADPVVPDPAAGGPSPTSSGGGPSMPALPASAQTGSGLLLGVFAWAVGLAYLQGGSAGVRKFFKAKFFNQV